jgi:hypothetical protein
MSCQRDDGSILVLSIGLLITAVMVATAVVNVASLWVTRSALNAVADGAALAGAQAIDEAAIYRFGLGSGLRLDPAEASRRVRAFVAHERSTVPGVTLRSVRVSGDEVAVTLSAPAHTVFGYLMPVRPTLVVAAAHSVNLLRSGAG